MTNTFPPHDARIALCAQINAKYTDKGCAWGFVLQTCSHTKYNVMIACYSVTIVHRDAILCVVSTDKRIKLNN